MEAIYRELDLTRVAGKTVSQALLETEIPLPAGREVGRVLHVEGTVHNEGARTAQGRVEADGAVRVQVLCLPPDGGTPFGLCSEAGYRHDIPLPEAEEGMRASVMPQLQELRCRAENGRLRLNGMVELSAIVQQTGKMKALQDVSGVKNLQKRIEELKTVRRLPMGTSTLRLRESIAAPGLSPKAILLQNAAAQVRGLEATAEGAALSGTVTVSVLCADQDGQMTELVQHFPFEELVPWQGDPAVHADEDFSGEAVVRDITVTPAADPADGLDAEITLGLALNGLSRETLSALVDAYAPDGSVDVTKTLVERLTPMETVQKKCTLRESLLIPEGLPEAYRAVYAAGRPLVAGLSDVGGRLGVDGVLFASVIFQTDEGGVYGFEEDIPFQCVLDTPYQPEAEVSARMLHAQIAGSGRMLEANFTLEAEARLQEIAETEIVVGAAQAEPPVRPTAILIYLAREGESFWDVGREFGLTVEQVKDWNPGIAEPLTEGRQLVLLSRGGARA